MCCRNLENLVINWVLFKRLPCDSFNSFAHDLPSDVQSFSLTFVYLLCFFLEESALIKRNHKIIVYTDWRRCVQCAQDIDRELFIRCVLLFVMLVVVVLSIAPISLAYRMCVCVLKSKRVVVFTQINQTTWLTFTADRSFSQCKHTHIKQVRERWDRKRERVC